MNVNEQTYHSIDAYLNGELKGRKLDEFKAELRTDKNLQKAVALQEEIIAAINENREAELRDYLTKHTAKEALSKAPSFRIWMLTAAAVALLIVAGVTLLPYISSSNKENTATDAKPKPLKSTPEEENTSTHSEEMEATVVDTQTLAVNTPPEQTIEDIEVVLEDEADNDALEEPESGTIPIIEKDRNVEENAVLDESSPVAKAQEDKKAVAASKPSDKPAVANVESTDIKVRGDKLLASKRYIVPSIDPDFSVSETRSDNVTIKTTTKEKSEADKQASAEGKDLKTTSRRCIEVEFWKSVVNYKGYQYDGSKVKLYGMDQTRTLDFKELDNRLYVKVEGKQYYLEKNTKYNRLVQVTNPTLLKVLNE